MLQQLCAQLMQQKFMQHGSYAALNSFFEGRFGCHDPVFGMFCP